MNSTAIKIVLPLSNNEREALKWLRETVAWQDRLDELRAAAK